MRLLLLLLALALALALLTACASAPQLGASAEVQLDACGQPVVTTTVQGVPAGPAPWQADVTTTIYRPCNTATQEAPDATPPR